MRKFEFLAAVAGTALALLVLADVVTESSAEPEQVRAVAGVERAAPELQVDVVVPRPPARVVDELPGAVAGVLAEHGHTELVSRTALLDELPPNVVGVLMEHGAVLRVSETEEPLP
jgi:hypothetical protein